MTKLLLLIFCFGVFNAFAVEIFNEPFYVRIEIPAYEMRDKDKKESYEWMLKYLKTEVVKNFPNMKEMSPIEMDKLSRSKRFKDMIADYNFAFQEYNLGSFSIKNAIPNTLLFPLIGGKVNLQDVWGFKKIKRIPGINKISTLAGVLGVAWMRKLIIRISKRTHQVEKWHEVEPAVIFQPYSQMGAGRNRGSAKSIPIRYGFGLVWGKLSRPSEIGSITVGASFDAPLFKKPLNVKLGAMLSGTNTLKYFRAYMDPTVDLKDIVNENHQAQVIGNPAYDSAVNSNPLKGMYSMFMYEVGSTQNKWTNNTRLNIGGLIHVNANYVTGLFSASGETTVEPNGEVITVEEVITEPAKSEVEDGCDEYDEYEINEMPEVNQLLQD